MGSCRDTYFYTSPGTRRRFAAVTLATCTAEGEFAVFTHRKDLERYEAAHPTWDHICYVGPKGGVSSLIAALRDHPENLERCWLDKHIINGRRPKAAAHTLFNLATRGVAKAGGMAAVLGLFPHAAPSLRCQVEALARARGGYGLALGLREYLGDAALARIMARFNVPGLVFAPPDVTEVREFTSMVARCYGPERATAVLSALSELPEEWREWMPLDPRTAATELATLSRDRSVSVRGNVARMVLCPVSVLETLSRDRSSYVRRYVAGNIHTPEDILVSLSGDPDDDVRRFAGLNPATPAHALEKLGGDPEWLVRDAVASNPSAPMGVLRLLRADKQTHLSYLTNPAISYDEMRAAGMGTDRAEHMSVVLNPACTADVISLISRNSDGYVQAWAARCKNVPEGVLVSLSKDPDSSLRHAAAISSRTPTYILEQLSRDKYPSVREAVAGNKNAPVAVLRTLSTDVDPHVSYRAARNEAATVDIRIRELQKYSRPHELYLLSRLAHEHPGTTPPPRRTQPFVT